MRWWALAKQFPKYALVFGIIVGSSVIFGIWWVGHWRAKHRPRVDVAANQAAIQAQAAKAEARIDYLFLADDDLYDAGTGELIFKNWLHGDHPTRLFYDAKTKKILGQYEQGFVRYGFDGTREAAMVMPVTPPVFFDDFKRVVFAKNRNVWIADADWQNFRFANERQVTTMGIFYEPHFAKNVHLLTAKTLVMKNLNTVLRVNLENGDVHPTTIPLQDIAKRRSPDSRWVVGMKGNQFYGYDVDRDEAKPIPVGRNGIGDYQWISNDKCLCLAGVRAVVVYDRPTHTLTEGATLPFQCFALGKPSPDGRFIFAAGGIDGVNKVLVNMGNKTATPVKGGAGITWVSDDTFAYSRDVPDSDLRGLWSKRPGEIENRLLREPLKGSTNGLRLVMLRAGKLFAAETDSKLVTMDLINSKLIEVKSGPAAEIKALQPSDFLLR